MTLTIELTADEEARLRSAKAQGIDVEALIKGMIAGFPQEAEVLFAFPPQSAKEEWKAAFTKWVESHDMPSDRPIVEFSRQALYEDCP